MHLITRRGPSRTPPASALAAGAILVALVLSACSDDDPGGIENSGTGETALPGTPSDDGVDPSVINNDRPGLAVRHPEGTALTAIDSPWLANVDLFQIASRPAETGDIVVELTRFRDNVRFLEHVEEFERRIDSCFVRDLNADDGVVRVEEDRDELDDGETRVSGGPAFSLTSAGGTWLSVPYSRERMNYSGDDAIPAAMPADLQASLPGDVFPAISGLALFVPAAPERLSPAIGEGVTPATEYRWVAGDGARDTTVRLSFRHYIAGEFQGFAISCRAADDGAFTLPDDALAEVARLPGTLDVRFARDRKRIEFRDGVAIYQTVTVADD